MESVTLHVTGETAQTITITRTGADTAHIDIHGGIAPSEDVKSVRADPTALRLTCQVESFFSTGDISVAVTRAVGGEPAVATITVSHLLLGDGSYVFPLRIGDDKSLESFLKTAGFPGLAAGNG